MSMLNSSQVTLIFILLCLFGAFCRIAVTLCVEQAVLTPEALFTCFFFVNNREKLGLFLFCVPLRHLPL